MSDLFSKTQEFSLASALWSRLAGWQLLGINNNSVRNIHRGTITLHVYVAQDQNSISLLIIGGEARHSLDELSWVSYGRCIAVPVHLKHVSTNTAFFACGPDAKCVGVCRLLPTHSLQVSSTPGSWWVRSWGVASHLLTTMYESRPSIHN